MEEQNVTKEQGVTQAMVDPLEQAHQLADVLNGRMRLLLDTVSHDLDLKNTIVRHQAQKISQLDELILQMMAQKKADDARIAKLLIRLKHYEQDPEKNADVAVEIAKNKNRAKMKGVPKH